YKLKADGIADITTLNKMKEILTSSYRTGKSSNEIRALKNSLMDLGFGNFPINPSKNYGNVTANVVKEFQSFYNLPVSGIIDEITRAKLNTELNKPYIDGSNGKGIVTLKLKLSTLGFGNFPSSPSSKYGSVSANVVKEFQRFFHLSPTGVADRNTLDKLNSVLLSSFKNGSKNEHVVQIKQNLTLLGFGNFPTKPSQTYGKVTDNVVKEFQQYYKIRQSGSFNLETLRKMNETIHSPYRNGQKSNQIKKLKQQLTALGFGNFPSNPSTSFG